MTTKTAATVVASVSNAAAGTTRGTVDLRTGADYGGLLTVKITNGATGPTVGCTANVLVAHNDGVTPAAASAGSDWKTAYSFNGGIAVNAVTEQSYRVDPAVQHLEVEFTGNTGQAVTVEAYMTKAAV